jgi:hypothetical protein
MSLASTEAKGNREGCAEPGAEGMKDNAYQLDLLVNKPGLAVCIAGGRDKLIHLKQYDWLDTLGIVKLYVGDATGIDKQARAWATIREINFATYTADWMIYGKSAGPIRNGRMLRALKRDPRQKLVIIFPGGQGTADARRQAERLGLPVIEAPR